MRKTVLSTLLSAAAFAGYAQTAVNDSVLLGSGYTNQVWYSLQNDEQGAAPKNEWDLAFNLKDISSPVYINSVTGVTLWNYPKSDTGGWGSVDTTGLSTWKARYNSDSTWAEGAMGRYVNPANPLDLDWGKYDMTTHKVIGDSVYIIKLAGGQYKKLWLRSLISGEFSFTYADLNGGNVQTKSIKKTDYPNKNFAYFSLQNNAALNREPDAAAWDLLFTQYTDMGLVYTVTGVLHNRGVRVAQANGLVNKENYTNFSAHPFNTVINEIGYDWKSYAPSTSSYSIKDSSVYFVRTAAGDIWKVIFRGFASTGGKFVFSKQKLQTAGIGETGRNTASISLYPNPAAAQQQATLVYNLELPSATVTLVMTDMAGRTVYSSRLNNTPGLHQHALPLSGLSTGMYLVQVQTDQGRMTQKLSIR